MKYFLKVPSETETLRRREFKVTDKKGHVHIVQESQLEDFKAKATTIEEIQPRETVVHIANACNQNCVYCLRGSLNDPDPDDEMRKLILSQKNMIIFSGGEPTLRKDLLKWIKLAKSNNPKDIVLVTNGITLFYKDLAKALVDSGVTIFNINFPSHIESMHDQITRVPGSYRKKVQGIKHLISLGAANKIKLTFVITTLNYKTMPEYAKFVKKEFPGIFHIQFNICKLMGYVNEKEHMVPRLSDMSPYFYKAMEYCRENNIKVLSEGVPLCYMEGYEENCIAAYKLTNAEYTFLSEQAKCKECEMCSLNNLCTGPREDYPQLYGASELKPSSKDPDEILKKIVRKED